MNVLKLTEKVEHLEAKVEKIEDSITEEILTKLQAVSKKVDDFQPTLNTLVTGIQKKVSTCVDDLYVLKANEQRLQGRIVDSEAHVLDQLSGLRKSVENATDRIVESEAHLLYQTNCLRKNVENATETTLQQSRMILEFHKTVNRIADVREMEKENDLDSLLKGQTAWVRSLVYLDNNGFIRTNNGKTLVFTKFKEDIQTRPWVIFPEYYAVECHSCGKLNNVSLRTDLSSFCHCKHVLTPLEMPKDGFQWKISRPCDHFLQVHKGTKPKQCYVCNMDVNKYDGPFNHLVRIPRKKEP